MMGNEKKITAQRVIERFHPNDIETHGRINPGDITDENAETVLIRIEGALNHIDDMNKLEKWRVSEQEWEDAKEARRNSREKESGESNENSKNNPRSSRWAKQRTL